MPNFFDSGVRYDPQTDQFRGHCDMCGEHQGIDDSGTGYLGDGWTTKENARNWIITHLDRKHQGDARALEWSIILGTNHA